MFYITGDTHGQFQHIEAFCERIQPSAKDTLIILGDAGFNYYGDWRDIHAKKKMSRLPITIFAIHGNHEQRPSTISSYHTMSWRGGQVTALIMFARLLRKTAYAEDPQRHGKSNSRS